MEGFFLSNWFAEVLRWIDSFIGNYAISIVLFTILAKLLMLPLDIKQRKSMHKTSMLKDKVDSIRKRYATDQQKMNQKIQELYKAEGVSMTAGCLPALLQLPIFIALLGAVRVIGNEQLIRLLLIDGANPDKLESFLWVHNIWQPDSGIASVMPSLEMYQALPFDSIPLLAQSPELLAQAKSLDYNAAIQPILTRYEGYANGWFILPLLAGGAQLLQTKLTPSMQQTGKVMKYLLPAISVYICVISNAAFALYWLASNIVSVGIQIVMGFLTERKERAAAPPLVKET